uniref:Variant surface glycoprotein 1125.2894 n=1 Tax=Trypanosoma brucei TaxID=5691 RepID=A0A1J0R941_9TRYP|nr:variant surface glycoprotein 1125.2894 [Trypanosoma brucei]
MVKKAVFGAKATTAETTKCEATMTDDRATDCTLPSAGQALCFAAVCICAQDGTQTKELCGTEASKNSGVGKWTAGMVQQKWIHVLTACKKLPPQPFSAHSLFAAAAGLRARFKQHNGGSNSEVFMGTIVSASHDCAQNDGDGCILITDAIPHGSAHTKPLTWLDTLEAAAAKQATIEAALIEAAAAKKRIHMLTKQAEAALAALKWSAPAPEYTTPSEKKTTSTNKGDDSLEAGEKECNTAKDNKDECKNLKDKVCTYDESKTAGQKCTVSEAVKQAAAKEAETEVEQTGKLLEY